MPVLSTMATLPCQQGGPCGEDLLYDCTSFVSSEAIVMSLRESFSVLSREAPVVDFLLNFLTRLKLILLTIVKTFYADAPLPTKEHFSSSILIDCIVDYLAVI